MDGASAAASTRGSAQTRAPLSSSPTSPRALPEAELHPILRLLAEGPSWGPRAAPRQQIARPASCPRRPRGLFRRPSARSIYLLLRGRYRDLHTVFYSVTCSKTSKNSWQSGQHFPQLCMAACSTPPGGPVPPPTSSHRYQPPLPVAARASYRAGPGTSHPARTKRWTDLVFGAFLSSPRTRTFRFRPGGSV